MLQAEKAALWLSGVPLWSLFPALLFLPRLLV